MVMWFILQGFLISISLLVKVFRIIYEKTKKQAIDENRRRFLRGLIWVPAVSATLYGGLYERRHIQFVDVDINADKIQN